MPTEWPPRFEQIGLLRAHLSALTDHQESPYRVPWKIDDAPTYFIDGMCRVIIGIEIKLSRIEGKWKVSQNRPLHDRIGVINGLRSRGDEASNRVADLVEAAHLHKT
jgi:transcriptional regulator